MRRIIVIASALIAGLAIMGAEPASAQKRSKSRGEKSTAPAAQNADLQGCRGNDLDARITACTRWLERTKRASAHDLALSYLWRGDAYRRKSDHDRAIRDFDEALRLKPDYAAAYDQRGSAHEGKKDYDRAIKDYDQAIRLDPKKTVYFNNRAWVHSKKNDHDRAIRDYDESLRLEPNSASTYNARGNAYHGKGDQDRAIRDYDEAIRLDPKFAVAYSNRADSYLRKNDHDRAMRDFDEAIRLNPTNASTYNFRGNAHFSKGDYDRSIRDYDEAIRINSGFGVAYSNRGNAYYRKRDYDRALRDLEEAIRLDPKHATAFFHRANVHVSRKDDDRAIRDYDEVIRLDPKYAAAYRGRGYAYYRRNDHDRAIRDFDEAIRLLPRDASSYSGRGIAYREKGDLGRALIELEDSIRLDPKGARGYFHRALVYERKGDKERALSDLRRALELDAGQQDARASLARLEGSTPATAAVTSPPAVTLTPVVNPPAITTPPATSERRLALVIGNDRYPNLPADKQLAKAVNDARAVGDALETLGFTVIRGENLDRNSMVDRIHAFTQQIREGDMAVVFFAGHGVALGGGNYILPADVPLVKPGEEARMRNRAIGEADIIADIQEKKARVAVLLLDACRDNPFRQPGILRTVGGERGLARGQQAEGVFAVYSAGFGQTALDSLGGGDASPNSVFTRVLVPALARADAHLGDLIIDMRQEEARLARTIGHLQTPAYYDQTTGGRIYIAPRSR